MKMFVLHHVHRMGEEEEVRMIGVYSTEEKANKAVVRLSSQPGFRDAKDGFFVDPYELDEDSWREGYAAGGSHS